MRKSYNTLSYTYMVTLSRKLKTIYRLRKIQIDRPKKLQLTKSRKTVFRESIDQICRIDLYIGCHS